MKIPPDRAARRVEPVHDLDERVSRGGVDELIGSKGSKTSWRMARSPSRNVSRAATSGSRSSARSSQRSSRPRVFL
jgi:hypothetical protein